MKLRVTKKQNNAKQCFVCGVDNAEGLHAHFYELEGGIVAGIARAEAFHQSYPQRVHGGVSSALIDEAIGRAVNIEEPEIWGVTVDLQTQFRKPVPYGEDLLVLSRVLESNRLFYVGEAAIYLADGTKAVSGRAKYLRMKLDSITEFELDHEIWACYPEDNDPTEIEVPERENFYSGKK